MGHSEDCSPGDSISDSSERLLQRVGREGQCAWDFGEGGMHASTHIFLQKVAISREETVITMKDFSACPGTEEPSGLPSMGLHRVGHD